MSIDHDRARGTLLGLACGDALGRPLEFQSAEYIRRQQGKVRDMLGMGTHQQPAGTITDDTDLAVCLARSLVECGGFDGEDVADRFVEWYEGDPFDIGNMTRSAILTYHGGALWEEAGERVWKGSPEGQNAGNGSLMRCAPHGIAWAESDAEQLVEVSRASSSITHADPRCTFGCALLNLVVAGLLTDRDDPVESALDTVGAEAPEALIEAVRTVLDGLDSDDLESTGYVVHTLQTALYEATTKASAEEAIVSAVNRGGDTDTVGAVTGALSGARFGADALPERWLDAIDETGELEELADELHTLSPPPRPT